MRIFSVSYLPPIPFNCLSVAVSTGNMDLLDLDQFLFIYLFLITFSKCSNSLYITSNKSYYIIIILFYANS